MADEWNFACPDWRERLLAGRSLIPDLPLDRDMASKAVRIFNKLRLPDVIGQPTLRDAAGDWQREQVAALFGSLDRNGRRRVRKMLCAVPKKNSKTTGAAAIGVTALLMDPAPRQPYFLFGPTQEIAQLSFNQASGMIEADPVLRERFHVKTHLKTIVDRVTESTLKVQTFDEKVSTGGIPAGAIVDELHILGKVHYASRVLGQIWGGMISRPGAFLYMITTQSDEPPAGVFRDEMRLARGIRDGRITGEAATTLPVLYEFPEEFQTDPGQLWRDPKCWPQVLPNLGKSVLVELLRPQYLEAVEKGDAEMARWASQHLNIEIGMGLHSERWRGADYWLAAAYAPLRDLDTLLDRCEVAVVGIDGGGLDDLTGVCVAGRDRTTQAWLYWFHAFAHRKVLDVRKEIAPRLLDFEADGDLTFWGDPQKPFRVADLLDDDGETLAPVDVDEDVALVVDICKRVRAARLLPEIGGIGVDPAAIGGLVDGLAEAGFTMTNENGRGDVAAVGQSAMNMFSAINTLERKLEGGTAAHGGAPMMAWCVGNAKAVQKGNSVSITKEVAGRSKIDPLIAGFVATKRLESNPVAGDVEISIDAWIAGMRAA